MTQADNSELDEIEAPGPEVDDLDDLDEDDLVDDAVELDEDDLVDDEDVVIGDDPEDIEIPVASPVVEADDDDDDEEEEIDLDDVEAGLDVILKDRLVVEDEVEDEDEEEAPEIEDRTEGSTKVQPKRPEEFVCQSCFLVKHPRQLADEKRMLCLDCV